MGVLTAAEQIQLVLDRTMSNVSVDRPLDPGDATYATVVRALNEAYIDVYDLEGGSLKAVNSAAAWTSVPTALAAGVGLLTDIAEPLHLFCSSDAASTGGDKAGDTELTKKDYGAVQAAKVASGSFGTHTRPQMYAVSRLWTSTPASIGFLRLDIWPAVVGFYYPLHYIPQAVPIDATGTMNLSDIGSRDAALMAAMKLAPLTGRPELIPGIMADLSDRGQALMKRKLMAAFSGDQAENP